MPVGCEINTHDNIIMTSQQHCSSLQNLARLNCVAVQTVGAFAVDGWLQNQLLHAGVFWHITQFLFNYDYTLVESGVEISDETNQQVTSFLLIPLPSPSLLLSSPSLLPSPFPPLILLSLLSLPPSFSSLYPPPLLPFFPLLSSSLFSLLPLPFLLYICLLSSLSSPSYPPLSSLSYPSLLFSISAFSPPFLPPLLPFFLLLSSSLLSLPPLLLFFLSSPYLSPRSYLLFLTAAKFEMVRYLMTTVFH